MVTFAFKLVCLILFMAGTRSFRLISLVSTRSRSSRQVKQQTIGLDLLCANRFRPTRWTPQNFIESTLRICSFSEIIFLTFSLQFSSCSQLRLRRKKANSSVCCIVLASQAGFCLNLRHSLPGLFDPYFLHIPFG